MQKDTANPVSKTVYDFLIAREWDGNTAIYLNLIANIIVLALVIFLIDRILRVVIIKGFRIFSNKTKTTFDDFLVKGNFPKYTAHIIPFIVIEAVIPDVFIDFPKTGNFLLRLTDIYLVFLVIWILRSIVKSTRDFLKSLDAFKDKPLESYAQILIIVIWLFGIVFIFSELTGQSIIGFLTTIGAASAILLLVFRDTILGFVASIQVSVNDMVRIGDWITHDKYGADGDVIEINLTTVKVRNFDKTITTIPTYALISDSFRNWRGMEEGEGRRIKRSVLIASESIRFLTEDDLKKLKEIELVRSYIEHRQKDIDQYNSANRIDKTLPVNGRNQTNIGVFRKYVEAYIRKHAAINKEMTVMVRQLEPTPQGVPLQVYAFSSDKRWASYEHIMGDIFDHLLAAVPYFGLRIFEFPKSNDMEALRKR
ncbi:MAG: mechanosensitive ion channel [Sinomicrobium sp.]|nr:mechanosensitive ion channel [Sinomicrobium sp.]